MHASQFKERFEVDSTIVRIDQPTIPPSHPVPDRPWFKATFTYRAADGTQRSIDYELGGGLNDTIHTITGAEMLYRMAGEARDGEGYQEYLGTYGADVGVTREQWEQGESAIRARCRPWITDGTMWEEFLSIEPDA